MWSGFLRLKAEEDVNPGPDSHDNTSVDYEQFENAQLAQEHDAGGGAIPHRSAQN